MVLENEADYKSRSKAIASIAEKFACGCATLRDWVNRLAVEDDDRYGLKQSERDELKALLVAETLTKAWANLDTLQDRQRFEKWVFRIFVNTLTSIESQSLWCRFTLNNLGEQT